MRTRTAHYLWQEEEEKAPLRNGATQFHKAVFTKKQFFQIVPERNYIKSLNFVICLRRTLQIMYSFIFISTPPPQELIYTLPCAGKIVSEILIPCN